MKKIEGTWVFADESNKDLGQIDLAAALTAFRSFPWAREFQKAGGTGCYPSVSFSAVPVGKHAEYLNISILEEGVYTLMIEAFTPGKLLGLIPRHTSACLDADEVKATRVEDFIKKLYTLPQESLYAWIKGSTG